uniref:Uncharacterized protein n=1 Tax=Anguilla anguilla TaxID=7936 RepID=A0A0E9QX55_ANGAN
MLSDSCLRLTCKILDQKANVIALLRHKKCSGRMSDFLLKECAFNSSSRLMMNTGVPKIPRSRRNFQ